MKKKEKELQAKEAELRKREQVIFLLMWLLMIGVHTCVYENVDPCGGLITLSVINVACLPIIFRTMGQKACYCKINWHCLFLSLYFVICILKFGGQIINSFEVFIVTLLDMSIIAFLFLMELQVYPKYEISAYLKRVSMACLIE